jgi:hypothetical protein
MIISKKNNKKRNIKKSQRGGKPLLKINDIFFETEPQFDQHGNYQHKRAEFPYGTNFTDGSIQQYTNFVKVPYTTKIRDLSGSSLRGAVLTNFDLSGVDLRSCDFTDANLMGANLSGAYLNNANLTNANLTNADLTRARLFQTNLTDADLTLADLSGSTIAGANFTNSIFDKTKAENLNIGWIDGDPNLYPYSQRPRSSYSVPTKNFTPPIGIPVVLVPHDNEFRANILGRELTHEFRVYLNQWQQIQSTPHKLYFAYFYPYMGKNYDIIRRSVVPPPLQGDYGTGRIIDTRINDTELNEVNNKSTKIDWNSRLKDTPPQYDWKSTLVSQSLPNQTSPTPNTKKNEENPQEKKKFLDEMESLWFSSS